MILVAIALSLSFFYICLVDISSSIESLSISYTSFSLNMAYIKSTHYDQFSNL